MEAEHVGLIILGFSAGIVLVVLVALRVFWRLAGVIGRLFHEYIDKQ